MKPQPQAKFPSMGDQIARFTITKVIEGTDLSKVFLAYDIERRQQDPQGGYLAALKFNVPDEAGHNYATMQNEVAYLRKFRHPGIVRVYPLGFDNHKNRAEFIQVYENDPELKNGFYAMEYLSGGTLEENMAKIQTFSFLWRLELFYQILTVFHYLHNYREVREFSGNEGADFEDIPGYAYWDLKPRNIMFRHPPQGDQLPVPVLIDFGSITYADHLYESDIIAATPKYSPPEVMPHLERNDLSKDDIIPSKVDVWTLGALFFEMMTGQPLVTEKSKDKITSTIISRQFATILDLRPDAPDGVDIFLQFMIASNPTKRKPTRQLIRGLEEIMEHLWPPRL